MRTRIGVGLVTIAVAGFALWVGMRRPPIPHRRLVVGYEHNPPYQVRRSDGSPSGLVIDTVAESARRAGILLEWRETSQGSEQALRTGAVDLWPLITDLPDRRRVLHISAPWLQSQHALVLRAGRALPDREFAEPISHSAVALHARLLREQFPNARSVACPEGSDALAKVCAGETAGAFLESRLALAVLRERPAQCSGVDLQAHLLPGIHALGVGSTFAAAGAADRIREEISGLARDGTLAVLTARNGWEALRLCDDAVRPVHLLLTDAVLPDLNGAELAERVRPRHPAMKVLYMSGYADSAILADLGPLSGVLLSKPFTPEVMLQRVRAALER